MKQLLAFHNKTSVKNKYVKRVEKHTKADKIVKGQHWENGKGCAVGCTIEGNDHEKYEKELGIPKELAYLEDAIFEELTNEEAMKFPLRFLNAVKVGSDLSLVVSKFIVWQFEDKEHGLKNIKEVQDDKEIYGFCEEVVALYKRKINGDAPTEKEFYALFEKIAGAGAGAWARAWAGSGSGAGAWAWAWALAVAGAGAWARAWARAWASAGAEYDSRVIIMAEKLLELIENA